MSRIVNHNTYQTLLHSPMTLIQFNGKFKWLLNIGHSYSMVWIGLLFLIQNQWIDQPEQWAYSKWYSTFRKFYKCYLNHKPGGIFFPNSKFSQCFRQFPATFNFYSCFTPLVASGYWMLNITLNVKRLVTFMILNMGCIVTFRHWIWMSNIQKTYSLNVNESTECD